MTYTLHLLPDVEEDVLAGYHWYEDKVVGLGEDFLDMFYDAIGNIQSTPKLYSVIYKEFRRCLLRRFPYTIYYKIENSDIIVLGLFHGARNPQLIQQQIKNRDKV